MTFSAIPDILWMSVGIWILLDCEVGISGKEKSHQWTTLAILSLFVNILRLKHRGCRNIGWSIDHGSEWFKIGSVVPLVRCSNERVGHLTGKHVASESTGCE